MMVLLLSFCKSLNIKKGTEAYYRVNEEKIFKKHREIIYKTKDEIIATNALKCHKKEIDLATDELIAFELMERIKFLENQNVDSLINEINKEPIYIYAETYEKFALVLHYTPLGKVKYIEKHHYDSIYTERFYIP